jgi:hypothetical protein
MVVQLQWHPAQEHGALSVTENGTQFSLHSSLIMSYGFFYMLQMYHMDPPLYFPSKESYAMDFYRP